MEILEQWTVKLRQGAIIKINIKTRSTHNHQSGRKFNWTKMVEAPTFNVHKKLDIS